MRRAAMNRFLLKLCLAAFGLSFFASRGWCQGGELDAVLANEDGLTYNTTYFIDISQVQGVSMQVNYGSTTYSSKTFGDGTQSSGTITVVTYTALSSAAATGNITIVSPTVAAGTAGSAVVVFGTNVGAARVKMVGPPGGIDVTIGGTVALGGASSATAKNFATEVDKSSYTTGVTVTHSGTNAYVTLTCIAPGTACNSFTVTSSSSAQISSAAFSGGVEPVSITVGDYVYKAGQEFAIGATSATMAFNLAAAITATESSVVVASAVASCPNNCGVVYATAAVDGAAGNRAITTSNTNAVTVSGAKMTGGKDNATLSLNGTTLTANTNFATTVSAANSATGIAAAFNAKASSLTVRCVANGAIVTATSTAVGTSTNYVLTTSTNTALSIWPVTSSSVVTGAATGNLYGGTNSSYTINSANIVVNNHGFTKALAVLYSGTPAIGGLTNNATYYVVVVDSNRIQLATTSALAQAGTGVVLTSSSTQTSADSYTLTPSTTTGIPSFRWEVSNDLTNWTAWTTNTYNISISSVTMLTYTNGGATSIWDPGLVNYKGLRLKVIGPDRGGVMLKAFVHGKGRS